MRKLAAICLALCASAGVRAEDLRSRLENLQVGDVLHDEATGVTAVFLQKDVGAGKVTGWQEAESKACGFKVNVFGPFNELKQEARATDGAVITIVVLGNHTLEGAKFTASCLRRSDNTLKPDFVENTIESLVTSGDVLERRVLKRNDLQVQHLTIRQADSVATFEMFQVESTYFQLIVEYPKSESEYMPSMAEQFLASFRP